MESLKPYNTKISFIRLFADMQVCTTYKTIKHFTRQLDINKIEGSKMLDVGYGDQPYRFLFQEPQMHNVSYVALDWEGAEEGFNYHNNDIIHYDGVHFPFLDEEFELVFHTEVAEHVQDVKFFFKECFRVLKNNGELLFSIPFAARYHYIPYDYWRLTPSSIQMILKEAGFVDINIVPRSTDIVVACYKVLCVGYRWLLSKKILKILGAIMLGPIWALSLLLGQISIWCNIGAMDDCLGYTVYARKR